MPKQIVVEHDDGEQQYRLTFRQCSLVDTTRYGEQFQAIGDWYKAQTGHELGTTPPDEWRKLLPGVRMVANHGQELGEILAALRSVEVSSDGGKTWQSGEWPAAWRDPNTFLTVPAILFADCLEAARELNPGLFPSQPDFLARQSRQPR